MTQPVTKHPDQESQRYDDLKPYPLCVSFQSLISSPKRLYQRQQLCYWGGERVRKGKLGGNVTFYHVLF